jgi:hypothetical protein
MVFPTYDGIRDQARFMRLTHAPEPSHLADRTIPVLSAIQNPTEKMMPAKCFLSLQALLISRQTSI